MGLPKKITLLVGFDPAWTVTNSGALVGALQFDAVRFQSLGPPQFADYYKAQEIILK